MFVIGANEHRIACRDMHGPAHAMPVKAKWRAACEQTWHIVLLPSEKPISHTAYN